MVDPQDADLACWTVNLVHDAIGTSSRGPQPIELATQPVADAFRLLREGSDQELDNSGGRLLGQACESTLG